MMRLPLVTSHQQMLAAAGGADAGIFGRIPEENQFSETARCQFCKSPWQYRLEVRALSPAGSKDLYFMTVKSVLIERLRPALRSTGQTAPSRVVSPPPSDTYSVTNYNLLILQLPACPERRVSSN